MVEQCYAIQNTYGKLPKQLKHLMRAMIEDLKQFELGLIEKAFLEWRRSSPNIPTPADIIKLIEKEIRHKKRLEELSKPNDHGESVNDYNKMNEVQRTVFDDWLHKERQKIEAIKIIGEK